jgi:predicted RNA-binding protein associated with RNAse of E/G family
MESCTILKKAYPHQTSVAREIVCQYKMGKKNFLIIARPQVGKTGTAAESIRILNEECELKYENVFLITNLNDIEWESTMFDRFPVEIVRNTYRRDGFKFIKKKFDKIPLNDLKVIIIDEPQYGSGINQTISYLYQHLNISSKEGIYKKNVIFIQLSATFDKASIQEATSDLQFNSILHMDIPKEYNGFENIDIRDYQSSENIENFHTEIRAFSRPKYHLVRIRQIKGKYSNTNCQYLVDYNGDEYSYIRVGSGPNDMKSKDFSNLLHGGIPEKHTIVYIKQCYRASNTLSKKHLGNMYEYISQHNVIGSVIVQSLAGRCCGYNCPEFYKNNNIIVRTSKECCDIYTKNSNDYVSLVLKNDFGTTVRDKNNKKTFNKFNKLFLEEIHTKISFNDIFNNEEFEDNLLLLTQKKITNTVFKHFIDKSITNFYFENINKEDISNKQDMVSKLKTNIVFSHKQPRFRIKCEGKETILTTNTYKNKNISSNINSFQCVPVYDNRNPNSSFSFIYIHSKEKLKK